MKVNVKKLSMHCPRCGERTSVLPMVSSAIKDQNTHSGVTVGTLQQYCDKCGYKQYKIITVRDFTNGFHRVDEVEATTILKVLSCARLIEGSENKHFA